MRGIDANRVVDTTQDSQVRDGHHAIRPAYVDGPVLPDLGYCGDWREFVNGHSIILSLIARFFRKFKV